MLFLHSHGVSTSRAVRIFKTYGEQAIEKVRENPYTLAKDIYGIGFATADQIAQKVGIPKESLNRARAAIDHVLLEATSDGHCALPLAKLKLAAMKLLEVAETIVEQALSQMLTSGSLLLEEINGEPLIFLPHLRAAEGGIAARIKCLAGMASLYPPIDFDRAVAWCERRTSRAALFRPNHLLNQQLNSSEWPIYCDHSVTSADVRLSVDAEKFGIEGNVHQSGIAALKAPLPSRVF